MSSLSATQADGYYLPPEYYDAGLAKKGVTKNQFANSKGHNQYLQKGIVRFELPYKGICKKCQVSIGRGTRYNAKKTKTSESYFTTPIWEFQMKCHNCSNAWVIRTNPKQRGFDYLSGVTIQQGIQEQDGTDVIAMTSASTTTIVSDALDRLESQAHGKQKSLTEIEQLQELQKLNQATKFNDSNNNALIRAQFRKERKEKRSRQQTAKQLGWREGMEVLPKAKANIQDQLQAKTAIYGQHPKYKERQKLRQVRQSSIFSSTSSSRKRRERQIQHPDPRPVVSSSFSSSVPLVAVSSSKDTDPSVTTSATTTTTTTTTSTSIHAPGIKRRRVVSSVVISPTSGATTTIVSSVPSRAKATPAPTTSSTTVSTSTGLEDMLAGYGSDSD